jgi:fumarate reductase flavoprotein subunit
MKVGVVLFVLVIALGACSGGKGADAANVVYTPGTYDGRGEGYEGRRIKVEVTVSENKILRIEVVEHEETPGLGMAAFEELSEAVLDFNSADVDAVSGATETSRGFLEAVTKALKKAQ